MKKILIALDYDPTAQKVAEAGYALATAMGASVTLLHVIADPVYYSSTAYSPIMGFGGYAATDFMEPDLVDGLTKASYDFLDKSKQHLGDTGIHTEVKSGDTADVILATAKDIHADMIVTGSHSRKWLDSILIGSVAGKVLHHTTVPLVIIPTKKTN
ncbi:MAG: universal stress protein [Chitinophagaceae bacterium]|nr:universal stress protein [Chitinophagaceae bacterium]